MNGLSTSCGTPGYLAPEIMKGQVYGPPVDIWAIGVITYILWIPFILLIYSLCGYPPFSSDNDVTMYRQILRGKIDFPSPEWDHVSDAAKDFISKLLIVDPEKRYTAKQVFFCFSVLFVGINATMDAIWITRNDAYGWSCSYVGTLQYSTSSKYFQYAKGVG